jgi:hypothetical protein
MVGRSPVNEEKRLVGKWVIRQLGNWAIRIRVVVAKMYDFWTPIFFEEKTQRTKTYIEANTYFSRSEYYPFA